MGILSVVRLVKVRPYGRMANNISRRESHVKGGGVKVAIARLLLLLSLPRLNLKLWMSKQWMILSLMNS
jgi:hypothetical protein